MSFKSSLVTVGMPVYNGEQYLRQAIDSLLAQDYKDFKLIILDNASTDKTPDICLNFRAQDKRILYYRNKTNIGSVENFNRVFALSSGDYFMWASHDDYWDKRYLQTCLKAFNASKAIVLSGTECKLIDPEGKKKDFIDKGISTVGQDSCARFRRYRVAINERSHVGSIFLGIYKRSVLSKVMPIKKVVAADHLILSQLCFLGEFITAPKVLMVKRRGGVSASFKRVARDLEINNPLVINSPLFLREIRLQKIIFQTDRLSLLKKIKTSSFSIIKYLDKFLRSLVNQIIAKIKRRK